LKLIAQKPALPQQKDDTVSESEDEEMNQFCSERKVATTSRVRQPKLVSEDLDLLCLDKEKLLKLGAAPSLKRIQSTTESLSNRAQKFFQMQQSSQSKIEKGSFKLANN
jgi:hypothetical protein